ncbi:MAG: hypothetical protein BWK75_05490 [Candidatus Altiarchaeales archaeon A3]|nr:MAG: hypothetical protein BWK75_05490 [Candidatus Altiarchaeales archaeon A3]
MKNTSQIMQTKAMDLSIRYVNKMLGMKFRTDEVQNLLLKAGMESKVIDTNRLKVYISPYRTDIFHAMDIVEDIAIAYGYENFIPEIPKIFTIGQKDKFQVFCDKIRNIMVGLNFQETMSLILTNRENLFKRMNINIEAENARDAQDVVETENALSSEHNVVRNYLLPSLILFLEKNKTKGYPQKIFEIGYTIEKTNGKFQEVVKISGVIAGTKTNFSEIKAVVEGILFGITDSENVKVSEFNKGFFIDGRAAKILIGAKETDTEAGFFGEISPVVIENFGIEVPVTAFEINLTDVYSNI